MSEARPRVAIACQGGGSHTAFSAGALKTLLDSPDHEFVAFSGTSGGAIDSLLAWYGLLRPDGKSVGERLAEFWEDVSADSWPDYLLNAWAVATHRALSSFVAPELSPYGYPEVASRQLRSALERHVDFGAIPGLVARHIERHPLPMLMVGAVDVRSGMFKVFRNGQTGPGGKGDPGLRLEVGVDAILASAAVPTLFRAVSVGDGGDGPYWDGLFSHNPPVRDLPEAGPEQIWVLQINPTRRDTEPTRMGDIRDRRNELAGNLSLRQELHFIEKINKMVRGNRKEPRGTQAASDSSLSMLEIDSRGEPRTRSYREIGLFCIQIPEEEATGLRLDYESKLDRDPQLIRRLFETGEREAERFLDWLAGRGSVTQDYRWKDDSDRRE